MATIFLLRFCFRIPFEDLTTVLNTIHLRERSKSLENPITTTTRSCINDFRISWHHSLDACLEKLRLVIEDFDNPTYNEHLSKLGLEDESYEGFVNAADENSDQESEETEPLGESPEGDSGTTQGCEFSATYRHFITFNSYTYLFPRALEIRKTILTLQRDW